MRPPLSPQLEKVLELIVLGYSQAAIAAELVLDLSSVPTYVQRLKNYFGDEPELLDPRFSRQTALLVVGARYFARRQPSSLRAERVAPREGSPPYPFAPGGQPSWRTWLDVGRAFSVQLRSAEARLAYAHALDAAGSALGSRALIEGEIGYTWRTEYDPNEEWQWSDRALKSLGLTNFPPETCGELCAIRDRLPDPTDETQILAYGHIARLRGKVCFDREEYGPALAAFAALGQVSRLLDDSALSADALQFRGRIYLQQATRPSHRNLAGLKVRPGGRLLLERALATFGESRRLRPPSQPNGLMHDLLLETTTRRLLGQPMNERSVAAALGRATELAPAIRRAVHLSIVHGCWDTTDSSSRSAIRRSEAHFLRALDEAQLIRSPLELSHGFAGLARATILDGLGKSRGPALNYAIAALLACPDDRPTQYVRHLQQRCVELAGSADAAARAIRAFDPTAAPYRFLVEMPNFSIAATADLADDFLRQAEQSGAFGARGRLDHEASLDHEAHERDTKPTKHERTKGADIIGR